MKVHVDTDLCTGHGQCQANAPEVFMLDELGFGQPVTSDVAPELASQARMGADSCPERAITIEP